MVAQTSILHVRVDDKLKADAMEKLSNLGLTISDAVHILPTYIVKDGVLPADSEAYDAWFHA
ncbi:type II toxin-antitoxin system RelB/DinJ family antitoxin [Photorhabdus caribbeanensis]|uniref:type II toxin-antitoxin system RelB/DinJ family antitoxin n=1 Tax=Photorhabdus caribbeanensis TaxID=1004165 RepID=UPI001FEB1FCD|nr:type II toxin-antitoxin system RelB/DinJ family antitoxin [Photorhabdus caribbeanensis]